MSSTKGTQDNLITNSLDSSFLDDFRETLYQKAFFKRKDTLFEIVDAINAYPGPVDCLAHLSLVTARSHHALSKAMARGKLMEKELRELLLSVADLPGRPVYAVDCTTIPKADAETSPDRMMCHKTINGSNKSVTIPGWKQQFIVQLTPDKDSWTIPVDTTIITLGHQVVQTVDQIERVCNARPKDGQRPVFALDSGYSAGAIAHELRRRGVECDILVRLKLSQVLWTESKFKRSGPRPGKHGKKFRLKEPTEPDTMLTFEDEKKREIEVSSWKGLHPKVYCPELTGDKHPVAEGVTIRVKSPSSKKPLWLYYSNLSEVPDLEFLAKAYFRRYDIEHTFKFMKTQLGLTSVRFQEPVVTLLWSQLVSVSFVELYLARGLVKDKKLEWEKECKLGNLSPGRTRRVFKSSLTKCFKISESYKTRGKGVGTPKGTIREPRERYKVLTKD